MKESIWHKDITHEVVGSLAVFGLVVSSLVTGLGVASLSMQAQVAFAEQTSSSAQTAAVVLAQAPTPKSGNTGSVLGATSYCPQLFVSLQRGSRDTSTGGQVSQLQQFLAARYNLSTQTIVTGYFGPITESYVLQFQREQGISPIGIVGPQTRNAVGVTCQSQQPTSPVAPTYQSSVDLKVNGSDTVTASYGYPVTLSWTTQNASSCSIRNNQTGQGGTVSTYGSQSTIGITTSTSYTLTCAAANGQNISDTVQIYTSSGPQTPVSTSGPTATLTGNGVANVQIKVGDSINYAWSSTGAVSAKSTYVVEAGGVCGNSGVGPFTWVVNTLSSSLSSGAIPACWGGHTITETYTVSDSAGRTASATVVVTVVPLENITFNASPTSGTAPLDVSFSISGITSSNYTIDFGDGSTGKIQVVGQALCTSSSTTCNPNIYGASHRYASIGTYTAKLYGASADPIAKVQISTGVVN